MNQRKIKALFMVILPLFLFAVFYLGYTINMKADIAENVLRLHIIGADNTDEAQSVKIWVRDRILSDFSVLFAACTSASDSAELAQKYKNEIEASANAELLRLGCDTRASVEIGESRFPTKAYGDITLPRGRYTAVKVKIGNATGENWWCVMYPPLCITDSSLSLSQEAKETLKASLTDDEYRLITEKNTPNIKIRFKIAEILGNIF